MLKSRSASGGLPSIGRSLVWAWRGASPQARVSRIIENTGRSMRTSASIVDGGDGLHTVAIQSKIMEPQYLESVTRLVEVPSPAITFRRNDGCRIVLCGGGTPDSQFSCWRSHFMRAATV